MGGPIFISIGDAEKLNTFLDANDWMDRDQMFVDDYSFDAYRAAGFGRFDQVEKDAVKNIKMTAPDLKFGEWINYFSIVGKVSPIPKVGCIVSLSFDHSFLEITCILSISLRQSLKFGDIPEGVLWTGGTFVIGGNDVLYQWTDTVPGNHPVVDEVFEIAKNAAMTKKLNKKSGLFSWL